MQVPRDLHAPSVLFAHLKDLFEFYRNKPDATTKKPLFNDAAWKRAMALLESVKTGRISDFQGLEMYHPLHKDKYGLMVFQCKRGTNSVENLHQKIIRMFGNATMCPQLADAALAEHREAHNYRLRCQHHGQPCFGHTDLDLADVIHSAVDRLWGTALHENYRPTDSLILGPNLPQFGVTPTHEADEVILADEVTTGEDRRSAQVKWLAKRMGVFIPPVPVKPKTEAWLFNKFVQQGKHADYTAMSVEWNKLVDLKAGIYPKIAHQLKKYHATWLRASQRSASLDNHLPDLQAKLPFLFEELAVPAELDLVGAALDVSPGVPSLPRYEPVNRWGLVEATLPAGHCIRDCGGCGHCFYFCLSLVLFGTTNHWRLLRRLVASALQSKAFVRTHLVPRYAAPDGSFQWSEDELYLLTLLDAPACDSWEDYCAAIRDTAADASLLEVQCVCVLFAIDITVHFGALSEPRQVKSTGVSRVGEFVATLGGGVQVTPTAGVATSASVVNIYGHYKLVCLGSRTGLFTPDQRAGKDMLAVQAFWTVTGQKEVEYQVDADAVDERFPWSYVRQEYGLTREMAITLRACLPNKANLFAECDEQSGRVRLSAVALHQLRAQLVHYRAAWQQNVARFTRDGTAELGSELETPIETVLEGTQRPKWAGLLRRPVGSALGRGTHSQLAVAFSAADASVDYDPIDQAAATNLLSLQPIEPAKPVKPAKDSSKAKRTCWHCGRPGKGRKTKVDFDWCAGSGNRSKCATANDVRLAYQQQQKRKKKCTRGCEKCRVGVNP